MKLRILVADDNAQFLRKTASILETEFEVVATAADGQSALESIRSCRPDVVVLDLEMPLLNGIDVTRELTNQNPNPKAIICSVETDPEIVEAALAAGALGYVFKSRIEIDLVVAVQLVVRGQMFVSPHDTFRS
jgi:two-component system response regulator NreC